VIPVKFNKNVMCFVYIRGRELQRRLAEREKEIEQDGRDRQREKEELEELKTKIFSEEHDDPSAEFERVSVVH
jgi:RNA-binding protein 25